MFTLAELTLMRQALDVITITGKDAQYVAQLQVKIEQQLTPPIGTDSQSKPAKSK